MEKICTYQKKFVPLHSQTKTNNNSKTLTIMTKEELSAKIAQGEYTNCERNGKNSVSLNIGDNSVSVTDLGSSFLAITCISVRIRENDYNKILKQALQNELEGMKARENELKESINSL